jgi:ADP-ribosylglycohydrolase
MQRYVRWYRQGYLSSTGHCFDIGNTVRQALHRFEQTGQPYSGSDHPHTAGNGSIMRLAPVPLAYALHPATAIERCAESSRPTHAAPTTLDACRYLGGLIIGALNGVSKDELLGPRYCPLSGYWVEHPLTAEIDEVAAGSFKKPVSAGGTLIRGTGYVVKSLEAALWAFHHSQSFAQGCLLAVNLGDDADTTGAVYGQLAGAYYGAEDIPASWRQQVAMRELIETLATQLFELAQSHPA